LTPEAWARLRAAKAQLDPQHLYPRPVSLRRVRVMTLPWLFRLPWFNRFDGYTTWDWILLRAPLEQVDDVLLCHELVHVWQMQHLPARMPLSYLYRGYAENPYEVEARRASNPEHSVTGNRG